MISKPRAAVQLNTGLGAGNIGDDLMQLAFWSRLPRGTDLDVILLRGEVQPRSQYPDGFRYHLWPTWPERERRVAWLVGATLITEAEGIAWPLEFMAGQVERFEEVHALGIGVDWLYSRRARDVFRRSFSRVRSWTVRAADCQESLIDLGVEPERIAVGADWAWLYQQRRDTRAGARILWRSLGVDPLRPLVVVNVVNLPGPRAGRMKAELAAALDQFCFKHGMQIAFLAHECRSGPRFDEAAARELMSRMKAPSVQVPVDYYSPDEVLGLLAGAALTVSMRYHFTIASVLAGAIPLTIRREQKLGSLSMELDWPDLGSAAECSAGEIVARGEESMEHREAIQRRLQLARTRLAVRAAGRNLAFVEPAALAGQNRI